MATVNASQIAANTSERAKKVDQDENDHENDADSSGSDSHKLLLDPTFKKINKKSNPIIIKHAYL